MEAHSIERRNISSMEICSGLKTKWEKMELICNGIINKNLYKIEYNVKKKNYFRIMTIGRNNFLD